jgi:hypothetical protein
MVAIPAFIYETVLMRRTRPPSGLLNAVPALEGLTCELARKGRAHIAEAKLRCPTNLGTSLARRSSILYRNLDSEPIMYLVYYMGRTCLTVELSRRSVARALLFSQMA